MKNLKCLRTMHTLYEKCIPNTELVIVERPPCKQSLVALTQQVGVEVVDAAALLAADVALPGVGVAVAALVQEVQRRVGERDGAERAHQRRRQQRRLAVRRRDHAALRRRRARRLPNARAVSRQLKPAAHQTV